MVHNTSPGPWVWTCTYGGENAVHRQGGLPFNTFDLLFILRSPPSSQAHCGKMKLWVFLDIVMNWEEKKVGQQSWVFRVFQIPEFPQTEILSYNLAAAGTSVCYLVAISKNYTFSSEAQLAGRLECEPQLPAAHLSLATLLSAGLAGLRLLALVFTHGLKSGPSLLGRAQMSCLPLVSPFPYWAGPNLWLWVPYSKMLTLLGTSI